jgi:hypothetical protein
MIAKDLYRLHREVEALEDALDAAPFDERDEIREKLRKVKAERDKMRKILDGAKDPPPYRKPM